MDKGKLTGLRVLYVVLRYLMWISFIFTIVLINAITWNPQVEQLPKMAWLVGSITAALLVTSGRIENIIDKDGN